MNNLQNTSRKEAPVVYGGDKHNCTDPIKREEFLPLKLVNISCSKAAAAVLARAGATEDEILERHRSGDWGDVSDEDKQFNDKLLCEGDFVCSEFQLEEKVRVSVCTIIGEGTHIFLDSEFN